MLDLEYYVGSHKRFLYLLESGFFFKEALMNSPVNDQSPKKVKCDFAFFFIFNGLTAIEYGSTALCCGNAELIRVSLICINLFIPSGAAKQA